jgi:soluble lytic murein transglycosylase
MEAEEQDAEQWRYWRGIALRETGSAAAGREMLRALAGERSYHGFLAADGLGIGYALNHEDIPADETVIAELGSLQSLIRARELFYVGLDSRGRSEWDDAVGALPGEHRLQAARLASRWGWHSRAIATAANVGEYDDLSIRYPLPWHEAFLTHSKAAGIEPAWAYGIARSESLFMRDVRSGAGAIGLMQLLPSTGRHVARHLSLPYSGLDTLTDPDGNIRLGTGYLGQMLERFGGNRVLATAAYNAGPLRVEEWLPGSTGVDVRIWVETIPFNETRSYVRRVLAAETIFHWRMTGETRRLSDSLPRRVTAQTQVAGN